MSRSLDEVDAGNFYAALALGYDVTALQPHPPGYPVYMFMAWLINQAAGDPLLSLTLLSALLGSLAVVPFYLLLRDLAGSRYAVAGSLVFLANPMVWAFSGSALSDVPSMFFAVLLAWLAYTARHSNAALLAGCLVASLAVGIRQANLMLLALLVFPIAYRVVKERQWPWRGAITGGLLFSAITAFWFLAMVNIGSEGLEDYLDANQRQLDGMVGWSEVRQVDSPRAVNIPLRAQRFMAGYYITHPWPGVDGASIAARALQVPWLFGFLLFAAAFRFRDWRHTFLGIWLLSLVYMVAVIHFLPRYGLAHLPAFVMACVLGYRFLAEELLVHPNRWRALIMLALSTALILFSLWTQEPVPAFEHTPPSVSWWSIGALLLGLAGVLAARWQLSPHARQLRHTATLNTQAAAKGAQPGHGSVGLVLLAVLAIALSIRGFDTASIGHTTASPPHRLAEYVAANYPADNAVICWGSRTHSLFTALATGHTPRLLGSIERVFDDYEAGRVLLMASDCDRWLEWMAVTFGSDLREVQQFEGSSPLWTKTEILRLYELRSSNETPNSP